MVSLNAIKNWMDESVFLFLYFYPNRISVIVQHEITERQHFLWGFSAGRGGCGIFAAGRTGMRLHAVRGVAGAV
ncbi:hypothetical protein [Herbaspirillum robiniae]|uniref:Uncharacterized protein n=1 Tax=Herbaspirillum robiniae TaxID=2014887 RepID=A0ABX2LUT7_9BURK|nr:hypothetical protein [Herbaspirillum robiniae]NUU00925.1 hypothetical protein [Herbaspirillum robiniae]